MQKHNAKKARNEREEGNGKKKGEKSEKEKGDKKTESKTVFRKWKGKKVSR